jgi:BirA family biotin operon repressor/biotin-[acetyl-CoA-carboxylase] ligase
MTNQNRLIGKKLLHFDVIDSTNEYAKKNFFELENGAVILSDEQTKGRGRAGRGFISNRGGLFFSIVYHSKLDISKLPIYTQLASVAVFRALEDLSINAKIKWPNDLYINGSKVCGILTELVGSEDFHGIIIGIGINVNNKKDEFIKQNICASSIEEETGLKVNRSRLLEKILFYTDEIFLDYEINSDFIKYKPILIDNSLIIGKEIEINFGNEKTIAKALDIDESGNLIIDFNGQISVLNAGEVHIKM